jgi:hypothetical protein
VLIVADGGKQVIEMRGRRSGVIYNEIMGALGAQDLKGELVAAKNTGLNIAKPHLKWMPKAA